MAHGFARAGIGIGSVGDGGLIVTPPSSGWSWFNQGASTVSTTYGGGIKLTSAKNNGSWETHGRVRAVPGSTYGIHALINTPEFNTTYTVFGLGVTDGTAVDMIAWHYSSGTIYLFHVHWTNATSYASNDIDDTVQYQFFPPHNSFLYLGYDGTDVEYGVSSDGRVPKIMGSHAKNFTPTHYGFFGASNNATLDIVTVLNSLREE